MIQAHKLVNFMVFFFSISVLSSNNHGGFALIALLLISFYILIFKRNEFSDFPLLRIEKFFVMMVLLFFVWQLFGVLYQPEGYEFDNLRRQIKALDNPSRWILLLPIFFLFRRFLINWKLISVGIGIGVLISVSIAIYQVYFLGINRAFSVFQDPIPFAQVMVVVDLILWMFMLHAWEKGDKFLSYFLLFVSLVAFYGSLLAITRGAWLAYLFMLLVWIIHTIKKNINTGVKNFLSTPVLIRVFFAAIVFFVVQQTEQFQNLQHKSERLIYNISSLDVEKTLEGRAEVFNTSLLILDDHIFGIGTDNFQTANKKYRERKVGEYRNHAHNELLNLMVENGIQGLLTLVILIGVAFKVFWNNLNQTNNLASTYAASGLLLIMSYAIFGLTQAVFSHNSTLIFFIFFLYFFIAQIHLLNEQYEQKNFNLIHD